MKKTAKLALIAFATSSVAAGVLSQSAMASAFWTRTGPTACRPLGGTVFSATVGCNDLTANSMILDCTVQDTDVQPKTSINTFNVHIQESAPSSGFVMRCVQFWNATGGSCGASVGTVNGTGATPSVPPTFAGWNTGNFGYLGLVIPNATASGSACLKGWFTSS